MEYSFTHQQDTEFRLKLESMSTEELQKLIWKLEDELRKMEISQGQNVQSEPEVDRVGIPKPMKDMQQRTALKSKILNCHDLLYRRFYDKVEEADKKTNYLLMISTKWGIVEKEPQIIIENAKTDRTYWKKYRGNEPVSEFTKMTITHCGDFYWSNHPNVNEEEMFKGAEQIHFQVPSNVTSTGRVEVQAEDIRKGYEDAHNGYANLKLVKVAIQSAEKLEYFMLMDIYQIDKIDQNELQQFLTKTYISAPHQEQVGKSLMAGNCLFGGIINKNSNGNLQLRFDDKYVKAAVEANKCTGTYRTLDGKEKTIDCLQDGIDLMVGRQQRINGLRALEAVKTGLEGR